MGALGVLTRRASEERVRESPRPSLSVRRKGGDFPGLQMQSYAPDGLIPGGGDFHRVGIARGYRYRMRIDLGADELLRARSVLVSAMQNQRS